MTEELRLKPCSWCMRDTLTAIPKGRMKLIKCSTCPFTVKETHEEVINRYSVRPEIDLRDV